MRNTSRGGKGAQGKKMKTEKRGNKLFIKDKLNISCKLWMKKMWMNEESLERNSVKNERKGLPESAIATRFGICVVSLGEGRGVGRGVDAAGHG